MQTLAKRIPYASRKAFFDIYFLGDIHLGAALCDEKLLDETITEIRRNPRALVFVMGDVCDAIMPRDKRFEAGLVAEWIDRSDVLGSQVRYAWQKLKPIAHKIIGILDGNHEETVKKEYSYRIKKQLIEEAREAGHYWKDLSYSALVRLSFTWKIKSGGLFAYPLTLYLHHGWGGGRGDGLNHYREAMSAYDADWFIFGHTHKRYVADSVYHRVTRDGKLVEERRLCGRSGSFLKSVSINDEAGYGEKKGYMPTPRGALCIRFYPHPHKDSTPRGWSWIN